MCRFQLLENISTASSPDCVWHRAVQEVHKQAASVDGLLHGLTADTGPEGDSGQCSVVTPAELQLSMRRCEEMFLLSL